MPTFHSLSAQSARSGIILPSGLSLIVVIFIACGPGRDEIENQKLQIANLQVQNAKLLERVRQLETAAQETPDVLFAKAQDAHAKKDYAAVVHTAELLASKHPSSDRVAAVRKLAAAARKRLAEAEARHHAASELAQKRARQAAEASQRVRVREVRTLLHRNLDGAGDGFVRGWRWNDDTFVLIVDERKYVPNSALAAALTARSIFDTGGVALPATLVFRDRNGNEIDRGPFGNVPRIAP